MRSRAPTIPERDRRGPGRLAIPPAPFPAAAVLGAFLAVLSTVLLPAPAMAQGVFVRGDCNQDQQLNITDPIFVLNFLFSGGELPTCLDACDGDDSETLNITDPILVLNFLFGGKAPPRPPHPLEDPDPSGTALTCLNGRDPPADLIVVPGSLTLHGTGTSQVLTVLAKDGAGALQDVRVSPSTRYLSADPAVAEVAAGVVTARGAGNTRISVRHRGVTREVAVRVVPGPGGPPTVRITSPADGSLITSPRAVLSGVVSDPTAVLTRGGSSLVNDAGLFRDTLAVPLGTTTFTVVATGAGGEGRASVTITRVEPGSPGAVGPGGKPLPVIAVPPVSEPDSTPPAIALTSPANGATLRTGVVLAMGTCNDPGAIVRVNGVLAARDGAAFSARIRLPVGPSDIVAQAVDTLGNAASATRRVTIDAAAPRLTLTDPAGAFTVAVRAGAVTLRGTVDPPGTAVHVNGVAANVAGAAWSADLTFPAGTHDLVVVASLGGSPPRRTHLSRALIADGTPPAVELAHPSEAALAAPGGLRADSVSIKVVGRLRDPGIPREGEGPMTLLVGGVGATIQGETFLADVPLSPGLNNLRVTAGDARGNSFERFIPVTRGGAPALSLAVVAGDGASARAGDTAPIDLVVFSGDEQARPRGATPVVFEVVLGDGTLDGASARTRQVFTGGDGRTTVRFHPGTEAGFHLVTASAPGHANSPVPFVIRIDPATGRSLAAHRRREFIGAAGQDLGAPLEARLLDNRSNPVAGGSIAFRVIEGGARFGAATETTATTGAAGVAAAAAVQLPPGDSRSIIEASHAGTVPIRFEVLGREAGAAADTAALGTVIDEHGQPVAGATVFVAGAPDLETAAEASGGFRLEGAPAGDVLIRAVAPGHAGAALRARLIAGRENRLPELRLVRTGSGAESARSRSESVSASQGALLSLPALPGLEVRIEPGSARFPDGSTAGTVTLAALNLSALPAPSPDDTPADIPLALLPEGLRFDPPARLAAPNVRSRAGRVVPLFQHRAAALGFHEVAGGIAAADGISIAIAPSRGLAEGGVFFFSEPGPLGGRTGVLTGRVDARAPGLADVPQRRDSHVLGWNVYAHSGEFFLEATDLELLSPGRDPAYRFRRRYESRHNFRGALGWNWEHEYEDRRLYPGLGGGNVVRTDGAGNIDEYLLDAESGSFVSPPGVFARLFADAEGFLVERAEDGTRWRHHPLDGSLLAGRLESITAASGGGRLSFAREPATGLISAARDAFGREVAYQHDGEGRITRVTDFTGRAVTFTYDAAGDLVAVTSPAVTDTPTENDFPQGVRSEYVYSTGRADERLNHNLVRVIDPREAAGGKLPRAVMVYGEDVASLAADRVISQVLGGTNATGIAAGGTAAFAYQSLLGAPSDLATADDLESFLVAAAGLTRYTDGEGRVTEVTWSGAGLPLAERRHTVESFYPRDATRLHPPPGTAPPFYERRWTWTREGLLAMEIGPRGDRRVYTYDEESPLRSAQASLVRVEHHPVPGAAETEPAVTTYRRDPLFGAVVEEVPPAGNAAPDPGSLATRRLLAYQEGADLAGLAADAGAAEEDVAAALEHAGIVLGLGDLNGDGATGARSGEVVRETPPAATLPDGTRDEGYFIFTYNRFGQLTSRAESTGRIVRFEYHPESDPDGNGTASSTPGLDPATGGFPARRIVEPGGGAPPIVISFNYDALGRLTVRTDGNGNQAFQVWNALGRLMESRLPPPLKYRRHHVYDADGNVVRLRVENYFSTDGGGHFLSSENRWIDTDLAYDLLGRPVTLTREVSEGEVGPARSLAWRYRYHPSGTLARVLHPREGTDDVFAYDERDLEVLHGVAPGAPEEAVRQTIRDESGAPVLETDADDTDGDGAPETTERRYDGFGRLVAVIDPAGGARVFTRDIAGRVVAESVLGAPGGPALDASGDGNVLLACTAWDHDERGRVRRVSRFRFLPGTAAGEEHTERRFHDLAGLLVRRVDPDGGEWTWEHDGAGRVVVERGPHGSVRRFTRDGNGNAVREVKETLTLDPVQPEAAGDPSYDEAGRFRETAVIVRIFDPLDRLTLLVDPAGGVWRARYDSQSNRTLVSDATGTVIDAATDVELAPILDLLTPLQRENANDHGNRRRYIYDNTGRMVEAQHELRREGVGGGPIDVENPFDRDGIITERFEWDDAGRLAAWTNDAGNVTRLDRDLAGKVTRKLFPDGTFQLHERDRDGHLQGLVAEDGTRHEQTFDALGRVVERSVTRAAGVEGTARQRFEYDGLGRVTAAFDGNDPANPADDAAVLRRYDSFGNLLEECQGDLVVGSAYDADSRRIGLTYPDGLAVQTPRDAAGRLAGLADPTRVHATYRWFGSGRLLEARIAPSFVRSSLRADQGGILRDVAHDAAGEELEVIYRDAAGEILHGFEYGRDRSGHQLYEAPFHGLEGQGDAWRYDSVYRVKTYLPDLFDPRVPPIDPLEKLVFYPDGNHSWRFIEVNFSIRRLEVNARSAYIESNDDVFTYDARGNLTTAGRLRFTYDALGRLVKVTRNTTTVIALYRYDASGAEDPEDFIGKGRRVAKEVVTPAQDQPAGVLRFAYDGERLIEERDGAGTLLRQYLHDESGPTALLVHGPIPQFGGPPIPQSPRPHTLLRNGAGSITGIADPTGAFIETAIYELHGTLDLANRFGNPVNFSGVGNAVLFGGHYYDYETGFHLHGARHFDPQLGRRLADASPPSPARPLELNGYLRPPLPGATGEVLGLPSRRRSAPELAPFQVDLRPRGQVPWTVPRVPVIDPLEELHAR